MKYLKTAQFVPNKGEALIFYECEDDFQIRRFVTVIPQTGEREKVDKPVVKKLFRPEMCEEITQEEFNRHWE